MDPGPATPRHVIVLARIVFWAIVANVASGAAVRLSDSGLGCPDWPTCTRTRLTPPASLHPVVEFSNRMVVTVLTVAIAALAVALWRARLGRRDLAWMSAGLFAGVIGEAVMGAIVVYSHLNAGVVVAHFCLGIALLALALVTAVRAARPPGTRPRIAPAPVRRASAVLLAAMSVVVVLGAMVTGSGPHAGGKDAKRLPLALTDITRVHAEAVWVTAAVLLVLLHFARRAERAEPAMSGLRSRGELVLGLVIVQGAIGYTQYALHLPAALVAVHVTLASLVFSSALWYVLHLDTPLPGAAAPDPDLATTGPGRDPVPV